MPESTLAKIFRDQTKYFRVDRKINSLRAITVRKSGFKCAHSKVEFLSHSKNCLWTNTIVQDPMFGSKWAFGLVSLHISLSKCSKINFFLKCEKLRIQNDALVQQSKYRYCLVTTKYHLKSPIIRKKFRYTFFLKLVRIPFLLFVQNPWGMLDSS